MSMTEKQERLKRANKWAKDWQERTGEGPGMRGYIDAFFSGYFNHSLSRSDGIESDVIQQFEELLDRMTVLEAQLRPSIASTVGENQPTITVNI